LAVNVGDAWFNIAIRLELRDIKRDADGPRSLARMLSGE
jgi:hypothetical protein